MKKMKQTTKTTIISSAIALAMLAGGIALGANADNIVDFAADKLGYEKVIEEEKTDETTGEKTDETDKEQSGDEVTDEEGSGDEGSGDTTTE